MAKKRSKSQNAVLFHHPDAVDTSRSRLMGRHAAGEGFLKGFVRHSGVDDFHCHAFEREHFDDFQRRIGAIDGNDRSCHWVPMGEMATAEAGTLMLSDPSLAPFSWRRRSTGNRGYSLCGLTHTIASNKVMDMLGDMLVAPLQPWDALICTSQVVKDTVTEVLDNWGDYLKARTGGKIKPEILLPVIPLGIDCDAYDTGGKGGDERQKIRRQLGIEEDDIVVLFMGRLSFHAKAHPTPMYLSLEEAAKRSGKRLHLIQAGWFANKAIEKEFREGVAAFCPSVNGIFLDGREPDVRFKVWFAADIFTSLSDNVQETFGLSPIEAMAAGLPVVASDWNGYRDTVRPGIDGFTIPTWLPLPRSGGDLALAPETKINPKAGEQAYDQYLGLVSQSTAVDVAQAADAFSALASEADLRRQMGEAGRKRARESFDWRRVVTAYQALWRDLETIRKREKEIVPVTKGKPALPLRDDPFSLYASYPTETLDGDAVVSIPERQESWADRLTAVKAQFMNAFAAVVLLTADEQEAILRKLEEEGPLNVYALAELIPTERRYLLSRTVAWLAKMDIVRLQPAKGKKRRKKGPLDLASEGGTGRTLVDLGIAARSQGALGAAARYFRHALEGEPDNPVALNQLGEILAFAGKWDEAKTNFKAALEKTSDYQPAQRNLGKVLFLEGDYKAAGTALEEAGKMAPKDGETKYLLGVCSRYRGADEDALRHLEDCLESEGHRADAFAHLGLVQNNLDRPDQAKSSFEKALQLDQGNILARAALMSLEAAERGQGNLRAEKKAKRIGLLIHAKYHYPLLKPLFDSFAEGHWPHISADAHDLAGFGPEVTLIADAPIESLKKLAPKTKTVNVRHGMAGRNFARRPSRHADYTCVSSKMARDEITATGALAEERLWITGYAPNDPLFQGAQFTTLGKTTDERKMVLYAPTHHSAFSSGSMLGDRIAALIGGTREDISIVIKPHPRTCEFRPRWMAAWEQVARRDPHVHLVPDPAVDIVPYLIEADVLVSDASGVVFQYLALDRPIVLITNPERTRDTEHYDPDAIEWQWRDIGEEVTDVAELAGAVERALGDPKAGAEKRARYRNLLFDDLTDGRATDRIVEKVSAL
jgi:glycosyltransferase involved in cell wall biosynthesis/Flp pilus assembly protein TadD